MTTLFKRKPEIKTALLVILGISLFIFGFSFLKRSSIFENNKIVHTIYDEVEGLVVGAKVTINGLVIGNVSMIDFLPRDQIRLEWDKVTRIKLNMHA